MLQNGMIFGVGKEIPDFSNDPLRCREW